MPQAPTATPAETAPTTHRPWGWFATVCDEAGYKVKRIHVLAGQQLSLQRHRHRAEHWIVVQGRAQVTVGERECELQVGEHVDIALGAVHRLANRTTEPLEIVEIQLGALLEEDDIERLEDAYGRV